MTRQSIYFNLIKKFGKVTEIEKQAGLDHTTLNDWRFNKRKTNEMTLIKIAEALGMEPCEVMEAI